MVAGGRRLKAMQALVGDGVLDAEHPVPCLVKSGDVEPGEISLAENVIRIAMHPADQVVAFPALQSGEIDLLSRNTTWTYKLDVNLGFEFVGVNYYDGQGFIARKDLCIKSAKELDGASVWVQTGTTTEFNLADFFRSNNMKFKTVVVEDAAEARQNYAANRCDVYTADRSGLAAQRSVLKDPSAHVILPEIISKEPLGPVVRHGDNVWGDIARWVRNALIVAEELGVTQANVDGMKTSKIPEINRLLWTPAPVRITPLAPVGPQAPPTRGPPPSRAEGASPRARVPLVDYRDKLPPRPWCTFTPPRRYIFTPPLTHVICRLPSLWRYIRSVGNT